MAEYLAAEILARFFPHRFEEDVPVIWIEHYDRPAIYGEGEEHTSS
jgi:hypothetical protein